jgi:endonuclease/exonuclease/phosphatase family metal-dependent hydrolase
VAQVIRITTWNVRRASYDDVAEQLRRRRCDVLVLQECARPDDSTVLGETSHAWRGRDPKTGVGVFTFGGFHIHDEQSQELVGEDFEIDYMTMLPWVLPVHITGGHDFNVMGVWADNSTSFRPLTEAVRRYGGWLRERPSIVAGDFNHHRKWDHVHYNERDHTVTMDELARLGLVSAYHRARGVGESVSELEDDMTFWQSFDLARAHHIDYVYAPANWIQRKATDVSVDQDVIKRRLSDHAAVTVTLHP